MSEKPITNFKMLSLSPHLLLVEFEQESLHLRKLFRKQLVLQVNMSNVEYHDECICKHGEECIFLTFGFFRILARSI